MIAGELESHIDHFFGKGKGKRKRKPQTYAMRRMRKTNTIRDLQALGGLLGRRPQPSRGQDFQASVGSPAAAPRQAGVPIGVWLGIGGVVLLLGGVLVYRQLKPSV